jgi:hypothetical protein
MKIVLSEDGAAALDRLLAYVWKDEQKHYEDMESRGEDVSDHIFTTVQTLNEQVELNIQHAKKKQQEEHQKKLEKELAEEEES